MKSRTVWVFAAFALIAAYLLTSEHQAHFIQALPYLLLLVCPVLHLFMHGGHGSHSGHGHRHDAEKEDGK
ncbi:MAG TPA: DUF2933 domain-containing protein [Burkholderiales bacterium]|jgi:hypothetical protein